MNIPPGMLKTRHRHIDKAIKASYALQAGLITGGEFRSIVDLVIDWCKLVSQLHGMKVHGQKNS